MYIYVYTYMNLNVCTYIYIYTCVCKHTHAYMKAWLPVTKSRTNLGALLLIAGNDFCQGTFPGRPTWRVVATWTRRRRRPKSGRVLCWQHCCATTTLHRWRHLGKCNIKRSTQTKKEGRPPQEVSPPELHINRRYVTHLLDYIYMYIYKYVCIYIRHVWAHLQSEQEHQHRSHGEPASSSYAAVGFVSCCSSWFAAEIAATSNKCNRDAHACVQYGCSQHM